MAASNLGESSANAYRRPGVITLLAILQFIGATFTLMAGAVAVAFGVFGETGYASATIIGVILLAFGGVQFVCGNGLWKLKKYGRTIQLVFAWVGLVGFPLGTIISVLIIVYLRKPGIRLLFSERPAADLTREEASQMALAYQSGGGFAILVIVVVLVTVSGIGIVAAIAVPGLLRARIAGNEASAIGTLRAINSANISYMVNCTNGTGYADSLTVLGKTPAAGQAFITADLALSVPIVKNGYRISYVANAEPVDVVTCVPGAARVSRTYFVTAEPVSPNTTGMRYFATSEGQIIFHGADPITAISADGVAQPTTASRLQ